VYKETGLHHLQEQGISLDTQLEHIEKTLLEEALMQTQHNATQAAKLLGISFRSIRYRMQKLGLKEGK
jgi:two-component system response regulator PilR (NtrC family)